MSDPAAIGLAIDSTTAEELSAGQATPTGTGGGGSTDKPRGLLGDAWHDLRRKPMFWIAGAFILLFIVMAAFPSLFTSKDPGYAVLERSRQGPSSSAWFGYDVQGADLYARVIYGTRASLLVAVLSTVGTVVFGSLIGIIAGFRGGWPDSLLSRIADIFFGIPFLLGAIVILFTLNPPGANRSEFTVLMIVVTSLVVLSWPVSMRVMRASVLATRNADYIVAARALGASTSRIVMRHLLPNCLAPALVYSTILLGSFIGAEATLSYLGVGLKAPTQSWGIMVAESQDYLRVSPQLLLFPAAFLVVAVLSFVTMGEAVREALDPKLR
ncbi:ABC transporter permease [Actinoplanes subtropicus]|uniref:ABC transporter permease n=1 Tax=Actinoplanes subtropicus TaxID=543632 RepID=UPI0004C305E4|nr:ABC transporter permease [Actinoplanes subtropicus]